MGALPSAEAGPAESEAARDELSATDWSQQVPSAVVPELSRRGAVGAVCAIGPSSADDADGAVGNYSLLI